MSDTNVSKVLGFINRSIIDFNFGIVSILDFQEKYFNPEKVFFKLLPSLMTKEGSLKDCTQREISIFSKFLLKSSNFFQHILLGYLLVRSKTFTFNILGRYQVKPFRKLDSLSSQLPILRFFSQNENTEIFFSETLIKVLMRKSSENKLRVVQSHFFKVSFLLLNPFHPTSLFLYPLNASESKRFSDNFMGYRKRPVAWNGLMTRDWYSKYH